MPEERGQHNVTLHEAPSLKNPSVGKTAVLAFPTFKRDTVSRKEIHFTQYSAASIPKEINTNSVSTDFCRALPQQVDIR